MSRHRDGSQGYHSVCELEFNALLCPHCQRDLASMGLEASMVALGELESCCSEAPEIIAALKALRLRIEHLTWDRRAAR